ncbi:hypothetical protein ACU686_01535 [Yinghuangia aomiensis]
MSEMLTQATRAYLDHLAVERGLAANTPRGLPPRPGAISGLSRRPRPP